MNDVHQEMLLAEVLDKACQSNSYRQQLVDSPRQTLMQAGLNLPEDKEVVVLEEDDEKTYLTLPRKGDTELDPDERSRCGLDPVEQCQPGF